MCFQIVNKLYEANWMAHDDVENMMKFDKDLQGIQVSTQTIPKKCNL